MELKIIREDDGKKGVFLLQNESGEKLGEMVYVWAGPEKLIIEHTEVDPALKGTGAGRKLVQAGVDFAREAGVRILPLCPFAHALFRRTPEYKDVWV